MRLLKVGAKGGCVTRGMSVVTGLRGRQKLDRGTGLRDRKDFCRAKELPGGKKKKKLPVIRDIERD